MINRLAITALVALLGSIPNPSPVRAQFSEPHASQEGSSAAAVAQYQQQRNRDDGHYRRSSEDTLGESDNRNRQNADDRHYRRSLKDRYDTRDKSRRGYVHRKPHAFPNKRKIAEENGYKRVSDLVNFPKFFPGLGIIFVKPETLPLGPFLCFDRTDRLVATVYMVPIKEMDDHKSFEAPGFAGRADHVSIYFNPGHPGVDMPHYHFVIWHVSKKEEALVAK
jgi:hypothetical protein